MTLDIREYFEQIFTETMEVQSLQKKTHKVTDKKIKNTALKPMTNLEKKNLGHNIRNLQHEYLWRVWEIVCEGK